jgi:tRNA A37 methylthiotransferase MiaB
MNSAGKVYVDTNGCIEGQLSSTRVQRFLVQNGVRITTDSAEADLMIFYACGLTEKRERDSLSAIKNLQARMRPGAQLIVWGCLPKINPQSLREVYGGPLLGPYDTAFFEGLLGKLNVSFDSVGEAFGADMLVTKKSSRRWEDYGGALPWTMTLPEHAWDHLRRRARKNTPFWIRVSSGCTGRCTYCSERCAFGRIRSRPINDIVHDFERGLRDGYNRFSLLATDLGAYGTDIGCSLPELLSEMISTDLKSEYEIELNQVEAHSLSLMRPSLDDVFASGKIGLLNSPVQSGSDRILRLMGRAHTSEEWKNCMLGIRRKFPAIRLSTHFMVGFPTETEEDFEATSKLLDHLFLDVITVFRFSARPTTPAGRIPGQISEATKELRARKLLQKHARLSPVRLGERFLGTLLR